MWMYKSIEHIYIYIYIYEKTGNKSNNMKTGRDEKPQGLQTDIPWKWNI